MTEETGSAIDPGLPRMRHFRVPELANQPLISKYFAAQNCALILTDHSAVDYAVVACHSRLIVDTPHALARVQGIIAQCEKYKGVNRPRQPAQCPTPTGETFFQKEKGLA